jgi:hypothetical protein
MIHTYYENLVSSLTLILSFHAFDWLDVFIVYMYIFVYVCICMYDVVRTDV